MSSLEQHLSNFLCNLEHACWFWRVQHLGWGDPTGSSGFSWMLLCSLLERDNLKSADLRPKLGNILKIGDCNILISISSRFGSPSPLLILMWNHLSWAFWNKHWKPAPSALCIHVPWPLGSMMEWSTAGKDAEFFWDFQIFETRSCWLLAIALRCLFMNFLLLPHVILHVVTFKLLGKKLIQSEATINDTHRYLLFTKKPFEQRGKLNSIKHKGYAGFFC